jgi:hypothetical protein
LPHGGVIESGRAERQPQRFCDVGGTHGGAELPGQDVAREVIEHGRQIEPASADDSQVSEIGLPQLIDRGGRLRETIGGLEQDESRTGNQPLRL